jgi:hypothetical protein
MCLQRVAPRQHRLFRVGALGALALLGACGGTDPSGVLTGRWGDGSTLLIATADSATIRRPCARIRVPGPLHLREDGAFDASGQYEGGVNGAHFAVTLAGAAQGGHVTLALTPGDPTYAAHLPTAPLTVRAGVEPDYSDVVCTQ